MKNNMIAKNVYWVGAIDWNLRDFHGYSTERGSTYNAFLVIDEKITLIDTVKSEFKDQMFENIEKIIPVEKIDYIISNHVEPDHSGCIVDVLKKAKKAKVFTSFPNGAKGLEAYYGKLPMESVKTGDTLNTGKYTFDFVTTPMVHWPDNMVCYLRELKILFSNDAFGQHYATSKILDVDVNLEEALVELKKYYANIVLPYGTQVKRVLETLKSLEINIIAPSHGVLWTKHIKEVLSRYADYANAKKKKRLVIAYDTMWNNTEKMAIAIEKVFQEKDIEVKIYKLSLTHSSNVMTELMDAEYIAIGSPTLNNGLLPTVASFLSYLEGLSPKGIKYVAFGSYGWGGQSISLIEKSLESCGFTKLCGPFKNQYSATDEQIDGIKKEILKTL